MAQEVADVGAGIISRAVIANIIRVFRMSLMAMCAVINFTNTPGEITMTINKEVAREEVEAVVEEVEATEGDVAKEVSDVIVIQNVIRSTHTNMATSKFAHFTNARR